MNKRNVIGTAALILVAAIGLLFVRQWFNATTTYHPSKAVTQVDIRVSAGDVTIVAGDILEVKRTTQSLLPTKAGEPTFEGTTLVLDDCGWWCSASYVVTVPAGTKVTGGTGSGDVTLQSMGETTVTTGSGDVTVTDARASLSVKVGSGEIALKGASQGARLETSSGDVGATDVRGDVSAKTGSGDIGVTLAARASVTASTGSGDIDLTVPAGSYKIAGSTGSGDRSVGVASDSSSSAVLDLTTGSGDVTVKTA